MAIALDYDQREIDPTTATVLLTRGDDWKLSGTIVDRFGRSREALDLSGASATAYFEAEDGSASGFPATVAVAQCGRVDINVPASSTQALALVELGQSNYAVIDHPTLGTITARSVQLVAVVDRTFDPS